VRERCVDEKCWKRMNDDARGTVMSRDRVWSRGATDCTYRTHSKIAPLRFLQFATVNTTSRILSLAHSLHFISLSHFNPAGEREGSMDAEPSWSPPAYDFTAPRTVASTDAAPSFFRSARWCAP
jgi:hypothetical protein